MEVPDNLPHIVVAMTLFALVITVWMRAELGELVAWVKRKPTAKIFAAAFPIVLLVIAVY